MKRALHSSSNGCPDVRTSPGCALRAWSRATIATAVLFTSSLLIAAGVCVWDGCSSSWLTYHQCIGELHGANPQAAAEQLRAKIQFGIRELKNLAKRPGRDGMIARNALDHIREELDR